MISKTYNRYLWLVNTLLQFKSLTFEEISRKWENSYLSEGERLSLRTFHAHRQAIEEMFQINIECDPSRGYAYYIEDAEEIRSDKARQWLLNSFNVSNMVDEGKAMQKRIILEDIPAGTEYLSLIIEAMKKKRVLKIDYQPFYRDETESYHVHPYLMRVHKQRWYVLAMFEEKDGLRHFSLDRLKDIEMTEKSFRMPKNFNAEKYYEGRVGIWVNENEKLERVVIRAFGQEAKYLRTLPLHGSQRELKEGKDFVDFEYDLCVNRDLIAELLSKRNRIEVLKPASLRKKICSAAKELLAVYKK